MLRTSQGGAGNGTAADRRAMSIGAVLAQLREEFPEVTISKIRFLEAEGLVEPERTPSGYRKFGSEDVEKLAQVLRMQRDHYLPLKVIREYLDALARGEQAALPSPGGQRTWRTTAGTGRPGLPPRPVSGVRSSWPSPGRPRSSSPHGSPTGSSCPSPGAGTTPKR